MSQDLEAVMRLYRAGLEMDKIYAERQAHFKWDFQAAIDEQFKHIKPGLYMIDPAKTGSARLEDLPPMPDTDQVDHEAETLRRSCSGYIMQANGERVLVHDYLGRERDKLIRDVHELNDAVHQDLPHASRERHAWQRSGVAMAKKCREVFGGSINVDEMGLGKTRQMIDLVMTQDLHPNDAFSLVITEKALLTTWAREAASSYAYGHRPRVLILDDTRTTLSEIMANDYDIVIVSYSAVMWQFKRLNGFKRYMHIWRHCGKEVAEQVARDEGLPTERPIAPLFSSLLDLGHFRIVTKILDEAHKLKDWDSKQRAAVQAINSCYVELVTGTPCGNVWTDILSLSALLPGVPFKSKHELLNQFAPASLNSPGKAPSTDEFNNLIRYLLPFTYGRSIDQLDLQGICYEPPTTFKISEVKSQRTLWLIRSFIRAARIQQSKKASDKNTLNPAIGYCTRAEQESGFPVLATYNDRQKLAMKTSPIDLKDAAARFIDAVRNVKANANASADPDYERAERLPIWADLDEKATEASAFTEAMTAWLLECGFQQLSISSATGAPSEQQPPAQGAEWNMGNIDDDIDDDTAEFEMEQQPDGPSSQSTESQDDKMKKSKDAEKPKKHQLFLNRVRRMRNEDIFTPRCEALMGLYQDIQTKYPGGKVIIWSRFYKYLVIIAEAFRRRHEITVPIYSGLLDTKQRDNMLSQWQSSHWTSSETPICFQAKAGGTGLTVNAASQLIFFEPWWNSQDKKQAERRAVRIGQTKVVHVWNLTCTNSFADAIINTGALRKVCVIDKIMNALRTPKGQQVSIPPPVAHCEQISNVAYEEAWMKQADAEANGKDEEDEEDEGDEGEDQPNKRRRLEELADAEDEA